MYALIQHPVASHQGGGVASPSPQSVTAPRQSSGRQLEQQQIGAPGPRL
jgi:hypothetical protein